MRAEVGDRLHVHGRVVGTDDQTWEIIGVRGPDGAPPYLVRRGDGHEVFVFPGADVSVDRPTAMSPSGLDRPPLFALTGLNASGELTIPDSGTTKRALDLFEDPCNYLG